MVTTGATLVVAGTVVVVVVVVVNTEVVVAGTVDGSWFGGTDCVEGGNCGCALRRPVAPVDCPARSPRAGIVVGGTVDSAGGGATGTVVVGAEGVTVVG